MTTRWMVGPLLLCLSCSAAPDESAQVGESLGSTASALSNKDFDVTFSDCSEFAGIGFVPAGNARPLVPAAYSLAGNATNAVIVVRVARCSSSVVDGHALGETITSQIGISVTGQDTTADINNYTLFYATNQALLHARYQAAGLTSDLTNDLSLQLTAGALSASSSSSKTPSFVVAGSAAVPSASPVQFIASWWANGNQGVVRSRTVFPAIRFGSSSVTLSTPAGSALALLAGSTTLTFTLLDSYNTFAGSQLEVRDTD